MQLVKDASSKTIASSDANAVALKSTLSNNHDTQIRASKGTQNIGPSACSNNVKESTRATGHTLETRLPLKALKVASDNAENSARADAGRVLLRRLEITKPSSSPGNSATVAVPTSTVTVSNPPLLSSFSEAKTVPKLAPVALPINDQPSVATGSPPLYWPIAAAAQAKNHRPEYISSFLHGFTERVIPTHLGLSLSEHSVHAWMYWVLATVSDPRSEQAKGLMRGNPGGVLFAAQLQLATAWSREIEEMAQRATTRDYYYDLLMRACGDARAKEWVSGRDGEEGGRRKRTTKGSGALSLRKRVLVGQGFKVYNEMVRRQSGEDSVPAGV